MTRGFVARLSAVVSAGTLLLLVAVSQPASASKLTHRGAGSVPAADISSAGPLTHVYLGVDLSCQVAHSGDNALELYPSDVIPGDCGSFLVAGSGAPNTRTLYAPNFGSHGGTATESLGTYTTYTQISQTPVTGSGTNSDPYKVITVGTAGANLQLTETDTYVVGSESYTTSVSVKNIGASSQTLILYRAGDCYLGGSDFGNGMVHNGAVACIQQSSGRIEEWVPITAGSNYFEAYFDDMWAWIGGHTAFPNTCRCAENIDNASGLSWSFTLAAGATQTFSHITTFSPTGAQPLTMTKTADSSTAPPGGADGYTITIDNPNSQAVNITSITDDLPTGFTYTPGSTTGLTTNDPNISGQTLTWNGSFTIPASGSGTLHFNVTVSNVNGTYDNQASATAEGFSVAPTGPTAPITVGTGADVSITKSGSPNPVLQGDLLTYKLKVSNAGPENAATTDVTDTPPSSTTFKSASSSQGTCSHSGSTITCSLGTLNAGSSATVTIVVTPNSTGQITNRASVTSETSDPNEANNTAQATTTVNPAPSGPPQTGAGGTADSFPAIPMAAGLLALALAVIARVRRKLRT